MGKKRAAKRAAAKCREGSTKPPARAADAPLPADDTDVASDSAASSGEPKSRSRHGTKGRSNNPGGRPVVLDEARPFTFSMPRAQRSFVEAFAAGGGMTLSEAARRVFEEGIAAIEARAKRKRG